MQTLKLMMLMTKQLSAPHHQHHLLLSCNLHYDNDDAAVAALAAAVVAQCKHLIASYSHSMWQQFAWLFSLALIALHSV